MASFAVDPDNMMDTIDDLNNVHNNVMQSLDDLDTAVANFIAVNQGDAVTQYQQAQKDWHAGALRMRQSLEQAKANLGRILENYHLGQQTGVNLFSR